MDQRKYNIPKTEKEITALLKDFLKGKKTIEDLKVNNETISITMDLGNALHCDGTRSIGTDEEELQRIKDLRSGKLIEVTLDLSK